jgi:hypothetical protein
MKMNTQIFALDEMLIKEGIPHTFRDMYVSNLPGYQIRIYADEDHIKELDDVIWHRYSRGYAQGLLETYRLNACNGFETAEEVFAGWKKCMKKLLTSKQKCAIINTERKKEGKQNGRTNYQTAS